MITREFPKLFTNFQYNGKTLLQMSSKIPSMYCTCADSTNFSIIRPLSGETVNEPRNTVNKHTLKFCLNSSLNRRSDGYCLTYSSLKRNLLYHNSVSINSVRHYTDFNDIRIALPSPFTNSAARAIAESSGVQFVMDQFVWLHSLTGLPWWATIASIGILARMTVFPLVVLQQRNVAKLQNLKHELETLQNQVQLKIMDDIERNRLRYDNAKVLYRKSFKEEYDKLIVRENCHPLRGHVAALLQLPLWISITFAIRNMSCMAPRFDDAAIELFNQLTNSTFLWITNLTLYDPYYVLPIALGVTNLTGIEIHSMVVLEKYVTKVNRYFTNFSRVLIVVIVPLISHMPSSIVLYWVTSSLCGTLQNLLLLSPKFRRLLKIQKTEIELEKPYSHLLERIRSRLLLKGISSPNGKSSVRR